MDSKASHHISYLELRISKLKQNPEKNQKQIQAYEKVLQVATTSTSYEEYIVELGEDADLFSLAQAEQIDRYRSMQGLYEKFGLAENAEVYKKRLEIASKSKSYADLATKLPQTLSLSSENLATEKINQSVILLQLLFQVNTFAKETSRKAKAKQAHETLLNLKALDESFSFDSYFKNPYLLVNPFTKEQLNRLLRNAEALLGESF
ncbi:hypothetical protein EHQ58_09795 [Leptospira ognonensis]|uniref:Uncharacterized protein n=1 Tax=Leptospira ognonensis TaxID=2484945 RepID=A0A4R9K0K6_9LEPT|nr:hypothetical protein [Leptospira ognonensis]TGL59192.1 hypothetical protein EHQ58_09795 [Leptospira ognonensis]